MSYQDDFTYDEAFGPNASVSFAGFTSDGLLLDIIPLDDVDDTYEGDTFTAQLSAELDADMAAAMFNDAFGIEEELAA